LSAETRINDLTKLKIAILDHQEQLVQALSKDFGCRSIDDSKKGVLLPKVMGINYSIKDINKWMKASKRHIGLLFQPAKAFMKFGIWQLLSM
tara:strand:+ start:16977 stop:17252 length:276 start_codon:yes stop_codon:yes gene_type:complete